jgi:hypothetical protein
MSFDARRIHRLRGDILQRRAVTAPNSGISGRYSAPTLMPTLGTSRRRDMTIANIRLARASDLERLTEIYNYYVINTPITFDLEPFSVAERCE